MTPDGARERLRSALPGVVSLVLFAAALVVLRRELHAVTWPALAADIGAVLPSRLLLALLLTALDYLAMAGHDVLAFAYIGKAVSRLRVAVASFIAYAIANNVGFASLSGASVRYRFFTRWGVSAEELSRIILFDGVGFWGGLLILGGAALVLSPLPGARDLPAAAWARPAGFLLLLMAAA
jgi:phosphatidylglycerol lysyltransferase